MSTPESLNNTVSDDQPLNLNENASSSSSTTPSTASNSSESVDSQTEVQNQDVEIIEVKRRKPNVIEAKLIDINNINHNLNTKWKIRGVITFKYDIRNFSSAHGDGQIFSFDIRDNTGEITITCFNLIAQSMEARIQKDQMYELTDMCIKTANETYKTLPNALQLNATTTTKVKEIVPFHVIPTPYLFMKLENLQTTILNAVVDIECRVIRDYGITTGISNDRNWSKRELHLLDDNVQCRLSLWNKQARFYDGSLAGSTIKCQYIKVKWYNGSKCLSSMDNTIITVE